MSKKISYAPKNTKFWERTAAHFNEDRRVGKPIRSWTEIKEHYYKVMRDVDQFSGWYKKFYYQQRYGSSNYDPLEAAFDHWDHVHSYRFDYMHIWRVMIQMKGSDKLFPLQIDCPAINKTKKPELNPVCHASKESEVGPCPMGHPEVAIEKRGEEAQEKGTKPKDAEKFTPPQMDHQANKKARTSELGCHAMAENKVQSRPMGQPEGITEKCGEEVLEEGMKQKEMKLKEVELMQKDYDIIMRDTCGMTNAQREFHFKFVNQIRARHK